MGATKPYTEPNAYDAEEPGRICKVWQLVEHNRALVFDVIRKKFFITAMNLYHRDELVSAGYVGLVKAAHAVAYKKGYDPTKSMFSTYAFMAIFREILQYRERQSALRFGGLSARESAILTRDFGCLITHPADHRNQPPEEAAEVSPREYLLTFLTPLITPRQLQTLTHRLNGLSLQQTADQLGLSKQRAQQIMESIYAIARKHNKDVA